MKFSDLKARRETYQKQAKFKKLRQVLKSTEMLQYMILKEQKSMITNSDANDIRA